MPTSDRPPLPMRLPPPTLPPARRQVVLRYDAGRGPITALAVTPEECVLAGGCGRRGGAQAWRRRCAGGGCAWPTPARHLLPPAGLACRP